MYNIELVYMQSLKERKGEKRGGKFLDRGVQIFAQNFELGIHQGSEERIMIHLWNKMCIVFMVFINYLV
jgi:hypothetical protein